MDHFFRSFEVAFNRSKSLLWPIKKSLWLKLTLLFLITGGCGGFPPIPGGSDSQQDKKEETTITTEPTTVEKEEIPPEVNKVIDELKNLWEEKKPLFYSGMAGVVSFFLTLLLLYLWISSRCHFILLKSLSEGDVHLRASWRETKDSGNSFFKFKFVVFVLPFLILGLGTLYAISSDWIGRGGGAVGVLIGAIVLGVFLLFFVLALYWLLDSFLPVIMREKGEDAFMAIRSLIQFVFRHFWRTVGYTFLYMLFATALYSVAFILAFVVGIPAFLVYILLMGILGAMGSGLQAFIVLLGVMGAIVGFIIFGIVFMVPLQTLLTYVRMELVQSESKSQKTHPGIGESGLQPHS